MGGKNRQNRPPKAVLNPKHKNQLIKFGGKFSAAPKFGGNFTPNYPHLGVNGKTQANPHPEDQTYAVYYVRVKPVFFLPNFCLNERFKACFNFSKNNNIRFSSPVQSDFERDFNHISLKF